MAIDPSIVAGLRGPQIPSPTELLQTVATVQDIRERTETRRLAADKARQEAKDQADLRRIMQESGGDWEKALPQLRIFNPSAAAKLERDIADTKNKSLDGLIKQNDLQTKYFDFGLKMVGGIKDQASQDFFLPHIAKLSPEAAQVLGTTYDPARVEQVMNMGLTAQQHLDLQKRGFEAYAKGDLARGIATTLSSFAAFPPAQIEQMWNRTLAGAKQIGTPQAILDDIGPYSPENMTRIQGLTIAPEKQAELAGQAAGRAQTAAHQAVLEQQGAQRIAIARQRLAQGTGTDRDRSDLIDAVIENPGLWDQITPTERGKIAGDLQRRGFTGFGKPLSEGAAKQIAQTDSTIESLQDLKTILKKNEQYIGPIAGLAALNPYSDARKAQADIDRERQRVGKLLEGGVLRKEDEEKYKKILATLRDEPSTAIYKVDQLIKTLQRDKDNYIHQQRLAGRRVPQGEGFSVTLNGVTQTFATAKEAQDFIVSHQDAKAAPNAGGPAGLTYQDYLNRKK